MNVSDVAQAQWKPRKCKVKQRLCGYTFSSIVVIELNVVKALIKLRVFCAIGKSICWNNFKCLYVLHLEIPSLEVYCAKIFPCVYKIAVLAAVVKCKAQYKDK